VAATLSGCAHDTAKPLASAKQPELLREFVPPPDVKITENGEVPILDAANGLPAKARVLLAEVPQAKPREGYVEYRVGVQPEGFQTVWVGTETIEPVFFGNKRRDTDNVYGIEPNFSQEPKDSVAEGRLRWLSSNPPLLLILAPEYMGEGTGHHLSRHDILVFFENGAPQVLLHEILGISGKSGSACQYGGDREIISETVAGGLKLTFIDSDWAEEDVDARSPLHPQWWPVQPEYPYETGYWYGEIATKRTRTWVFADGRLTLESEKLEYKVQPGDTWEDIAVGFFKDAKFAEAIRKANPGLGKAAMPPEGSWITLPPGARLYP
jgi:hypothetical protein